MHLNLYLLRKAIRCSGLLLSAVLCMSGLAAAQTVPTSNPLEGNITIVRDPSIIRQGKTYYIFSTDPKVHASNELIPIRCSQDRMHWKLCGHVFEAMPMWAQQKIPQAEGIWAPDISFFGGLYHLYYSVSSSGSQLSGIAFATNTTLDLSDASYHWVDHGPVVNSRPGDDFNAIDPNIFVDSDHRVWMTYGSYWSGIKQREVNPGTGMILDPRRAPISVAFRPDHRVVEGPSLIFRNGFYYLFVSYGRCCSPDLSMDDYKEAVGRSSSVHGPFLDRDGRPMSRGGGTIIVEGDTSWVAPGGGSAWIDDQSGESFLVFHSLDADQHGRATLWLTQIKWDGGWPSLR